MNNFTCLILIVGTNPLPNFVVADYFLFSNPSLKKIILIYSEKTEYQCGTEIYADNLQKLLQSRNKDTIFCRIHLSDVSNAREINRSLKDRLAEYLQYTGPIHLNYTGGTKAMGIHVYRWLEEYGKNKNIPTSFSYLDARTFQIVDDNEQRITGDLRDQINLSLEELIRLHGFERKDESSEDHNLFNDAIKKFKELIDNDRLKDYFDNYKREVFTDEKGNLLEKTQKLRTSIVEKGFNAQGAFLELVNSMLEDYRLFNPDGSFKEPKTNKHLKKAIEFIDGRWLEQYVYKVLRKNLSDENIYINWSIRKPEWDNPSQKFELDVIIIKGYQLIGISCTTSDRLYLCKSKGFEIFMRTRQIGGEEARAVLITRLLESQTKILQAELEVDTGGKENILVLGVDDLKEEILIKKIKDFIKQ